MEPFTTHTGRAIPLRRSNVDTDQIIPAEYLKRVSRIGFADGLFAAWRADPEFILNQPVADGATVLSGRSVITASGPSSLHASVTSSAITRQRRACSRSVFRRNSPSHCKTLSR